MEYAGLVKRLRLPQEFTPPRELRFGRLRAIAITREDLDDDVRGINASLELIRRTRGGGWPTEPVTTEGNYMDLVWHEREFREHDSFSCGAGAGRRLPGMLLPVSGGRRVPLDDELITLRGCQLVVTPDAYAGGTTPSCSWHCGSGSPPRFRSPSRITPTGSCRAPDAVAPLAGR
jgi:hypothetical protein